LEIYQANFLEVGCFNDVFSFWQNWNNLAWKDLSKFVYDSTTNLIPTYEFRGLQKRISSLNVFRSGIFPAWEDEQNKGGGEF
jgi:hypothetical protein